MTLAELVAADYAARLRSFGARAPDRFTAEVAGLTIVGLGVDEAWSTQVVAMPERPVAAAVAAAVDWCRRRDRDPQVMVRAGHRPALPHLDVVDELPALVAPAGGSQDVIAVEHATDVNGFCAVYAAAFGMPLALAEALVVEADLAAPELAHLVGRVDGRAVACAQVRIGPDTAYISGVGVLPDVQRRGYGAAILAASRVEAACRGCGLVWLNAAPGTVPFYERIGFELVDTHVALAAPVSG